MSASLVFAAVGWKALLLMYIWLGSAIIAAALSRSKGYGEKPGLGTGLILSAVGAVVWLFVPPKDETAEWHTRKPWQPRRKPKESEMAAMHGDTGSEALAEAADAASSGTSASDDAGAGSRPGESRDTSV